MPRTTTHCVSTSGSPNSIQGRNPGKCWPAVSQRTIVNHLLAIGLDHMCLWSGYNLHHDTVKHDYSGVVKESTGVWVYMSFRVGQHLRSLVPESTGEWNGALLSLVMRVGSVCMQVMDVHVYGIDLVSIIFQSAFAHDKQAQPQASLCGGGASVTTRDHIWLLTLCYCHFFDRKLMYFFSRTMHIHIQLLQCNMLFVLYTNCPGEQDSQISRQLNMYGTW